MLHRGLLDGGENVTLDASNKKHKRSIISKRSAGSVAAL